MYRNIRSRFVPNCKLITFISLPTLLAGVLTIFTMLRPVSLHAQSVAATINTGGIPVALAVNPVTNKIYSANYLDGTVTVINGAANTTSTVTVGSAPSSIAVNPTTNKIYVTNNNTNNVSVIDGTNDTVIATVAAGTHPYTVAVNSSLNKIYVVNVDSDNLTVIDGDTNLTSTIDVGAAPEALAVNISTNRIYVTNANSNSVTVIDGFTNRVLATVAVTVGLGPIPVAVNSITNKIYVGGYSVGNNVSVIDGATNTVVANVGVGTSPYAIAVNPAINRVYVANFNSANVTVLDGGPSNSVISTVSTGVYPLGMAISSLTNKIYVANSGSGTVTVIDGTTNGVTSTLAAGTDPGPASINPVTDKIYIGNAQSNDVTVIDGAVNSISTFSAGMGPQMVAVNPATNKVYIANQADNDVTVYDPSTRLTTNVATGNRPSAFGINPVTNQIYVANRNSNSVTVIGGATNSASATINVGIQPLFVEVNPLTNKIYVGNNGGNSVTVIDGASNSVTATIATGLYPDSMAINRLTNRIYVSNLGSNSVTVIDGATNLTTTISVGSYPAQLGINPVTNKIYVPNSGDTTVSVIDGFSNAVVATVTAGSAPQRVDVNPLTNKIYVSNGLSNDVTIIDGVSNTTTSVFVGAPGAVTVNPVTNKIYLANFNIGKTITVIDGITNLASTIPIGIMPGWLALNPLTDTIYASNLSDTDSTVVIVNPELIQSVPLTTQLQGLTDTQTINGTAIFATTNTSPLFQAAVTSSYLPNTPQPTALYYQLETEQGAWQQAVPLKFTGTYPIDFNVYLSSLPVGVHTIYSYAVYGEQGTSQNNGNANGGNSPQIGNVAAATFVVMPVPTASALNADINPQFAGSAVSFIANVQPADLTGTPSGAVTFFDDSIPLGQVALSDTGQAVFTISTLAVGLHPITSIYSGDMAFASSTATYSETINVVPPSLTRITLSPTSPSIHVGNTQQFTATGHYSDNSTQDLTSTATWTSSSVVVATINSSGLASGVTAGNTNIAASLSGVTSANATLVVFQTSGIVLVESIQSLATAPFVAGGTLTITESVANNGSGPAGAMTTLFYLSTSTSPKWKLLGNRVIVSLASGATSGPASTTLSLPANIAGAYSVMACANGYKTVAETDSTHDCASVPMTVQGANLVESTPTLSGAPFISNGTVTITESVTNNGLAPAGSMTTLFYLATPTNSKWMQLGNRVIASLASGATSGPTATPLTLPSNIAGTYSVTACANAYNTVAENTTAGNCATSATMQVVGADLSESNVTFQGIPVAGQPLQVTDTTTNVGYATAGSSSTAFYLSTPTNAKWMYLGNRSVGALSVAAFSTVTTTLSLPANLHGTYSISVCANAYNTVADSNTANNCSSTAGFILP